MRDGYLRGALSRPATRRQMDVLAAFVAVGGSVHDAATLVGIRPSTVKRHLADLRAKPGLSTEQLIYVGRAAGWLVVPSLESLERFAPRAHPGLAPQAVPETVPRRVGCSAWLRLAASSSESRPPAVEPPGVLAFHSEVVVLMERR